MRKSDVFLLFVGSGMLLFMAILVHAHFSVRASLPLLLQRANVAHNLRLTDLCLSTEAGYTRHLSQSDWHAAFQSHPLALDLFPSGSVLPPPKTLKKAHDQTD